MRSKKKNVKNGKNEIIKNVNVKFKFKNECKKSDRGVWK